MSVTRAISSPATQTSAATEAQRKRERRRWLALAVLCLGS